MDTTMDKEAGGADPGGKRWHAILDRLPKGRPARMVEIGVWTGILSGKLLARHPLLELEMVDPYRTGEPGTAWWESGSGMPMREQAQYDRAFEVAKERTGFAGNRRRQIRKPSLEAVLDYPDHYFDLVFVDGDHSFEGCLADIRAWIPKVAPGGWIGGHDYGLERVGKVRDAVEEAFGPLESGNYEVDRDSTWWKFLL